MIITAKYDTTCPLCGSEIKTGTSVKWTKGSPAHHVDCADAGEKRNEERGTAAFLELLERIRVRYEEILMLNKRSTETCNADGVTCGTLTP